MLFCNGSSTSVPDGTSHDHNTFCTTPRPHHHDPLSFLSTSSSCDWRFVNFGPNVCRDLHQTKLLYFDRLSSPYRALPRAFHPNCPACVWSPLASLGPHISLAPSCSYCSCRTSCNDICSLFHTTPCDASQLLFFLSTKMNCSLDFSLSSSQSIRSFTRE